MWRRLLPIAAVTAIAMIRLAPASAAVVTFGALKDASVFQNNPDFSNGAGPGMFAGDNGMDSPAGGCSNSISRVMSRRARPSPTSN